MDDRPVGVNRDSKYDSFSKDLGLAREYCLLEMYKNNEEISKNKKNAVSSLNENSASDVNMMKRYVGVFNESDRFEDEDLENLPLGSAKLVVERDFEWQDSHQSKEIRAKRNVPGKRKPGAGTLCEIQLPAVENLDQTTDKLSSRQLLLANNSYGTVQTLDERKMLKLNNLANPRPGSQRESICQEASSKATDADVPIPAPLGLDFHSKDLVLNDAFLCKPVTWESEESTIVPSFPTTPSGCATISKSDSENSANRYQDYLMNMDEEQSNSHVTKTPSPSLGTLMNAGGNWEMTEEMFNLNSAGKFSAGRKRFSRRASSVGARGSPETNSLICYIAKQKMQESQRVSVLKSKITAFMDTFQAAEQDANRSSTTELSNLPGLSQTSSKEQKSILSMSCSKPLQKKKVTFGEALSPELFDERLPSNTPLRKGESPVYQRLTFSDGLPSALKQRSKARIGLDEEKSASTDVACNGCSPVNDHGDSISIKLQTKLEDDLEISATGTQNEDEDRCCPIAIDFEIESPPSECNVGPDNLKSCDKSDEYPCEVLEMKIQEMNEIVPLAISPSGCPGEGSNASKGSVAACRNLTKKKDDCIRKKLLKIKPEPDKKITTMNKLRISEIERESEIESGMDHIPSEAAKSGNGLLDQNSTDLSINDVQTNSIGETCPQIHNLSEQTAESEDKKVRSEALDADVSSNPTIKPKEKVKTEKVEQESKKEEPRRSTRIKNNANNISKSSTTATKQKYRQKFKKDLYGKREYASKKPLLSPIAEILDIWSESADLSDSDEMSKCESSMRSSLVYLEGVRRKGSQCMPTPECIADRCAPASLTEVAGQKAQGRGRARKRPVPCLEEEQNIQSDSEGKTPKGSTGVCWFVPKRSNQSNYSLKSGSGPSPSLCEDIKDMAFEVKELEISRGDNVTNDRKPTSVRRKSSIKIKNKYFSEEPSLETSRQGTACVQNPSAGQCVTEAGLEEYSEQIHADDYNGVGSLLESGSNILDDFSVHQHTDPGETQELTPVSASEKSQVIISEAETNGITALEEKDLCIFLPDAQEVFLTRPSHRRSKLFSAADLPCMTESEQALEGKGHCFFGAREENEDKDQNISGRVERKEGDSCNMIPEFTFPSQQMFSDGVSESQETTNSEPLFFSFDLCLEQKDSNTFEAAKQFETRIKCSDGFVQNAKPVKKKVRRSARLSGCMSKEGLTWVDVKSPGHSRERNASARSSRRSLGPIESESKLRSAEDVLASKTASQASIRILYRRSLSCNREKVSKLEEPLPKSIILD